MTILKRRKLHLVFPQQKLNFVVIGSFEGEFYQFIKRG
mgnify:CR=1 FL=1